MVKSDKAEKFISFLRHPDRRNFFIYSIGAFFLKGISFFLIPLYTNLLSAEEVGHYDLLRNFGSITEIILSLGLLQLIYVEYFNNSNISRLKLVSSFISIYLVLSTGLYILLGIFMYFTSFFFLPSIKFYLVIVVLLTTYLNFFQVLLISVLKLSFQAIRVSSLQVILGCTNLLLNVVLVYGLRKGVDGIIVTSLVVTLMSCSYGMIYFRKQLSEFKIDFDLRETVHYLKTSLPFIPNILSFWIMNSANRWILLHYSGIHEVGIYSVAARFTAVLEPLFIEPFMSAYTPSILKRFKEGNYNMSFLSRYLSIPIIFICAGFLLKLIGALIIGVEFVDSLHLILPLALAYSFNLLAQTSSVILIHQKMINTMLICVVAGSVISILVNFILVPAMGATGSAWSIVAGNAVWVLLISIFAVLTLKKVRLAAN